MIALRVCSPPSSLVGLGVLGDAAGDGVSWEFHIRLAKHALNGRGQGKERERERERICIRSLGKAIRVSDGAAAFASTRAHF